jgi:phenylpyruvate tautomerase PptA (4-oxalocrotonate tautomerase family)
MIGDTPDDACADFTAHISDILGSILGIPADSIYVTFHPMKRTRWGWNGSIF